MDINSPATMDAEEVAQLRAALCDDLANIGKLILAIKDEVSHDSLEQMAPSWKATRFRRSLCEAATSIIRAMDCLMEQAPFTNDQAVDMVIKRWEKGNDKDKDAIVQTLRTAFTKPSSNGKGKHP